MDFSRQFLLLLGGASELVKGAKRVKRTSCLPKDILQVSEMSTIRPIGEILSNKKKAHGEIS